MYEQHAAQSQHTAHTTVHGPMVRSPQSRVGSTNQGPITTYYGLPVIHGPHWRWPIVWYFLFGGLAGGSAVLTGLAHLLDRRRLRSLVRAGRYLSFLSVLPGPLLLIEDLGRPERFHHMLRVVKLRSPMSLGVWGLMSFSAVAFLAALQQAVEDRLFKLPGLLSLSHRIPHRLLASLQAALGFFLAGYTGVLLGATAVPLWARNALRLGPLFLCSALSSATALLHTLLPGKERGARHALERIEVATLLGELVLLEAIERQSGPIIGRPLREGREGMAFRFARFGTALSLLLKSAVILTPRSSRGLIERLVLILTLSCTFALRAALLFGGRRSADDPDATFALTRKRNQEEGN